MLEPFAAPSFQEQLQADKATLAAMIENQLEYAKQLMLGAGDPLQLGAARALVGARHETYIRALERALEILNDVLE